MAAQGTVGDAMTSIEGVRNHGLERDCSGRDGTCDVVRSFVLNSHLAVWPPASEAERSCLLVLLS
jgi:hypothetical protein